jgi:SHS2 domain-containing protein
VSEPKKYRILNRSSDLAAKIYGGSQTDLFANAGHALFELITDMEKVQVTESLPLEVDGVDRDDLMVNWVRELLYLYQGSGYLLKEFKIVEVKDDHVRAEVRGEKFDPDRHEIKQEIKAVAYHQSRMDKTGNEWTAQVLFQL